MVATEAGDDVGTEPYVWTMGFDIASFSGTTIGAAEAIFEAWKANWASITQDTIRLDHVDVTVPITGGGTGTVTSISTYQNGGGSFDPSYIAFAPKIRKLTPSPGRKFRGVFHPAGVLPLASVDSNGQMTPEIIGALITANEGMLSDLLAIEIIPVLLHSDSAVPPTLITGFQYPNKVGILRERMV
jgi:hypothetical protein